MAHFTFISKKQKDYHAGRTAHAQNLKLNGRLLSKFRQITLNVSTLVERISEHSDDNSFQFSSDQIIFIVYVRWN